MMAGHEGLWRLAWGFFHLWRGKSPTRSVMDERIDRQIAAVARRRGGHVTRRQLLALGLTSRQIDSRIERGWLIPAYRGVYAVGHRPVLPVDRAHGALLAAGPKTVLSHRSAASLRKL